MLWIVGTVYREFAEYLHARSIPFGIFAARQPKRTHGASQVVVIDITSPESVQASVHDIRLPVSSVVALYEQYVLPAAVIAELYDVPGLSQAAALACTNKLVMRERFKAAEPSITPAFSAADSLDTAIAFAGQHGFPVVLKPSNLMKSLLVTISQNEAELRQNYEQTMTLLNTTAEKFHAGPAPLIIEQFLDGSMHTVAAFADKNGEPQLVPGIVDCLTAQNIGKSDMYLFSRSLPSSLSKKDQHAINSVAAIAMHALSMQSSAAHIEIMLTAQGPKVIEVGARLGGYRPRLYQLASGIDLYEAQINTINGQPIACLPKQQDFACALEIFPDQQGTFKALSRPELLQLPSVQYFHTYGKPGRSVGPAKLGYKAAAVAVLAGDDQVQVLGDCSAIRDNLSVLVD